MKHSRPARWFRRQTLNWNRKMLAGKRAEQQLENWKSILDKEISRSGDESDKTYKARVMLAGSLIHMNRLAEAQMLLEHQISITKRVRGEGDSATLGAETLLAAALLKSGKPDRARELYVQVHKLRQEILGNEHRDTISTRESIAKIDGEGTSTA